MDAAWSSKRPDKLIIQQKTRAVEQTDNAPLWGGQELTGYIPGSPVKFQVEVSDAGLAGETLQQRPSIVIPVNAKHSGERDVLEDDISSALVVPGQ